ncbi:unnamed protein product [Amoebophrya sp. A25]|nr:unnamed protein product [Amoebophrya sp. A25]|eukprot:GSA25T00010636001.1
MKIIYRWKQTDGCFSFRRGRRFVDDVSSTFMMHRMRRLGADLLVVVALARTFSSKRKKLHTIQSILSNCIALHSLI